MLSDFQEENRLYIAYKRSKSLYYVTFCYILAGGSIKVSLKYVRLIPYMYQQIIAKVYGKEFYIC